MRRERRLDNVRSCHGCTDRTRSCNETCEDFAIREILDALVQPEIRATVQLNYDLNGIKRADIARIARKKSQSRRR